MAAVEASTGGSVLGTIALIFLAIVGLSIVDTYLARTERSENRVEADRLATAGRAAMEQGHALEAVAHFKSAIGMERENSSYWLALGEAQMSAGQLSDAEGTLTELLRRDSTAGAVNLALARVLMKENRIPDAVSAYHRAIYGHWDGDAEANRIHVRFELVNLLAQQGAKEELLAELLPLLDVSPNDTESRMRLGHLFLLAGSAPRAAEIFREVLHSHPRDADAYTALGKAEFARANYQTAHTDFQMAEDLRPSDQEIRKLLDLTSAVLSLDPMRRGLSPEERYRRSLRMLEIAAGAIKQCSSGNSPLDGESLENAQKALTSRVSASKLSEALESNLNLAEELWKVRQQQCKQPPTAEEEPLGLVLVKIAQ
jgi:tetratricopeptide (TPR) repeat protein